VSTFHCLLGCSPIWHRVSVAVHLVLLWTRTIRDSQQCYSGFVILKYMAETALYIILSNCRFENG